MTKPGNTCLNVNNFKLNKFYKKNCNTRVFWCINSLVLRKYYH